MHLKRVCSKLPPTERGKALLHLSNTDSLTGLENRRAVDQRLRDHWQRCQDDSVPFAVLLIDVDYFKRYNDCYGHQEGDRCLVAVSQLLPRVATGSWGSDHRSLYCGRGKEFIVITSMPSSQRAVELAEAASASVIRTLAWPHEHMAGRDHVITVRCWRILYAGRGSKQVEKVIHRSGSRALRRQGCGL